MEETSPSSSAMANDQPKPQRLESIHTLASKLAASAPAAPSAQKPQPLLAAPEDKDDDIAANLEDAPEGAEDEVEDLQAVDKMPPLWRIVSLAQFLIIFDKDLGLPGTIDARDLKASLEAPEPNNFIINLHILLCKAVTPDSKRKKLINAETWLEKSFNMVVHRARLGSLPRDIISTATFKRVKNNYSELPISQRLALLEALCYLSIEENAAVKDAVTIDKSFDASPLHLHPFGKDKNGNIYYNFSQYLDEQSEADAERLTCYLYKEGLPLSEAEIDKAMGITPFVSKKEEVLISSSSASLAVKKEEKEDKTMVDVSDSEKEWEAAAAKMSQDMGGMDVSVSSLLGEIVNSKAISNPIVEPMSAHQINQVKKEEELQEQQQSSSSSSSVSVPSPSPSSSSSSSSIPPPSSSSSSSDDFLIPRKAGPPPITTPTKAAAGGDDGLIIPRKLGSAAPSPAHASSSTPAKRKGAPASPEKEEPKPAANAKKAKAAAAAPAAKKPGRPAAAPLTASDILRPKNRPFRSEIELLWWSELPSLIAGKKSQKMANYDLILQEEEKKRLEGLRKRVDLAAELRPFAVATTNLQELEHFAISCLDENSALEEEKQFKKKILEEVVPDIREKNQRAAKAVERAQRRMVTHMAKLQSQIDWAGSERRSTRTRGRGNVSYQEVDEDFDTKRSRRRRSDPEEEEDVEYRDQEESADEYEKARRQGSRSSRRLKGQTAVTYSADDQFEGDDDDGGSGADMNIQLDAESSDLETQQRGARSTTRDEIEESDNDDDFFGDMAQQAK